MGGPITLFSGYSQRENRTTNYCLLLLKMIYEKNPNYLGEVLSNLCRDDNIGSRIGVSFRQQERKGDSVPDGLIVQTPVAIYIETKNYDWFYDDQLERHLQELHKEASGIKVLIALGNFEAIDENRFSRIEKVTQDNYGGEIYFFARTFEDLVDAMSGINGLPKDITDALADFSAYLDEESLLPSWERWIDIVSCTTLPTEVLEGNAYLCPAMGGAYSHGRCKYFGMYREKRVEKIALIKAMAEVDLSAESILLWSNVTESKQDLIDQAASSVKQWRPEAGPTRVLLLGELFDTNFIKDSPGGIRTKTYMEIARLNVENAQELAKVLDGKQWSEIT